MENSVNCWNPHIIAVWVWTISSQATWKQVEGSTIIENIIKEKYFDEEVSRVGNNYFRSAEQLIKDKTI
jgi:hypothetical protein